MSGGSSLFQRFIGAAVIPVLGLLAIVGASIGGASSLIIGLIAGGTAVVGAAVAGALAVSTQREVVKLLKVTRGVTVDSLLAATATEETGGSSRRHSAPEGIHALGAVGTALLELQHAGVEAAVRHGEEVRQGFATPLLRLAQRNQMLLERQLAHLDGFEDGERDPDVLDRLFRLDQLATEMRRTNEGLAVLTGVKSSSTDDTPVPLLDVVRGAASGVEAYARVRTSVPTDAWIIGTAANDLAGLLAELIDNACRFSLPDSPVDVRTVPTDHGLAIVVRDVGPGMVENRYVELNTLLSRPPLVDRVSGSAGLGLVIASHLAARLSVSVTVRPGSRRGVIATVVLGPSLLVERHESPRPARSSSEVTNGSVPLMVAQLRRHDRLASRQNTNGVTDRDERALNGARNGGGDGPPTRERYFNSFSPAAAPEADEFESPLSDTRSMPALPPLPQSLLPGDNDPLSPASEPSFSPLPSSPPPASRPNRRRGNAPVFKLADTGAVPPPALLGPSDDLAAHGLVRRVPKASLQFEEDASGAAEDNSADRPSPEEIRRRFSNRQEGIRRAEGQGPSDRRGGRPGVEGGNE
jgi:signal transduction histidine kinase